MEAEGRFWAKVDKSGECWLWTGSTNANGYGEFFDGRAIRAHQWAYRRFVGEVPPGAEIDHLCGVRRCVRATHLRAVSHAVNVLRSDNPFAINARKTHCLRGHPLSGPNLLMSAGTRQCRECKRNRNNALRARQAVVHG